MIPTKSRWFCWKEDQRQEEHISFPPLQGTLQLNLWCNDVSWKKSTKIDSKTFCWTFSSVSFELNHHFVAQSEKNTTSKSLSDLRPTLWFHLTGQAQIREWQNASWDMHFCHPAIRKQIAQRIPELGVEGYKSTQNLKLDSCEANIVGMLGLYSKVVSGIGLNRFKGCCEHWVSHVNHSIGSTWFDHAPDPTRLGALRRRSFQELSQVKELGMITHLPRVQQATSGKMSLHAFPVSFQGLSQSHVSCGNTILHQQHPLQSPTLSHFLTPSPFLVIAYPLVANSLTNTKPANLPLLRRNTTSICPRASDVCCVSSSDGLSISSCDTPTPPPGNWGAKKSNFLEMR